jgi:hypothetical protein
MNRNLTEITFLLDRSGSMGGLESDTIGGFNAFLERQSQLEGETIVTTVLFDDQYEILWNGVKANEVKLTDKDYYVRGCTALLDAVGKTILDVGHRLSTTNEEERPGRVIFVITTDGLENASREFTYEKVKGLIKHQQDSHLPSRYSYRHSHFQPLQHTFRYTFCAAGTLPYQFSGWSLVISR